MTRSRVAADRLPADSTRPGGLTDQWAPISGHRSVGVDPAVVLEDPARQRDRADDDPDEEEPPGAGGDAEDAHPQRQRAPQRPPRVRREEPELTGAVGDLAVLAVLGA